MTWKKRKQDQRKKNREESKRHVESVPESERWEGEVGGGFGMFLGSHPKETLSQQVSIFPPPLFLTAHNCNVTHR